MWLGKWGFREGGSKREERVRGKKERGGREGGKERGGCMIEGGNGRIYRSLACETAHI